MYDITENIKNTVFNNNSNISDKVYIALNKQCFIKPQH